jgi:hypothetical protein
MISAKISKFWPIRGKWGLKIKHFILKEEGHEYNITLSNSKIKLFGVYMKRTSPVPAEQILMEAGKKGDKSAAVRAFIAEHGNLPGPRIRKALATQGVVVSLPQIYNVKRELEPKPPVKDIELPDSVPLAELTEVLEFSKKFKGGIKRLKQVVDVIWSLQHC